jgi:hypothetical protein
MRNTLKCDTDQQHFECASVDSSALAASAAKTGLSSNTDAVRASVAGGTTITLTWVDETGSAFNYTSPPVVIPVKIGAVGSVSLTSSAVGSAVLEVSAGTVDFHVMISGSKKPSV